MNAEKRKFEVPAGFFTPITWNEIRILVPSQHAHFDKGISPPENAQALELGRSLGFPIPAIKVNDL